MKVVALEVCPKMLMTCRAADRKEDGHPRLDVYPVWKCWIMLGVRCVYIYMYRQIGIDMIIYIYDICMYTILFTDYLCAHIYIYITWFHPILK